MTENWREVTFVQSELDKVDSFRKQQNTSVLVILFTDLKSSTKLREDIGDIAFGGLLKEHDNVLIPSLQKFNGEYIKGIGDGILAVFSEPSQAVRYALYIQETFADHNLIKIKIGMDMGQVAIDDSVGLSPDVFGRFVNRAARIVSLAEGGHILVSSTIQDSAIGWLNRRSISWSDFGLCKVKGVDKPLHLWEPFNANICTPMPKGGSPAPTSSLSSSSGKSPGDTGRKKSLSLPVLFAVSLLLLALAFGGYLYHTHREKLNQQLLTAVRRGDDDAVEDLLFKGADINTSTRDREGDTPLILALDHKHNEVSLTLVKAGADLDRTDNRNNTPLMVAINNNSYEMVKVLLDKGAKLTTSNDDGNYALLLAVDREYEDIVRLLLEKDPPVNTRDNYGNFPLAVAADRGNNEILRMLIDEGANLDMQNSDGNTALHLAVLNDRHTCAEILVEAGAQQLPNKHKKTPEDIAREKDNNAMLKILQN